MELFIWDDWAESCLIDLLFESNIPRRDIAREIGCSELEVTKRIRDLGLGWVKREANLSRGHAALVSIMRKLVPGEKIVTEEPLPERLRLDVYCPTYKLAAEYHGRQHFQYVQHFHNDYQGFLDSQRRDARKEELCQELGIALVIVRYCDRLDEDAVFERMMEGLRNGPVVEAEKKSIKGDPYYESWKQRQRDFRKQAYRKMKSQRYGR